LQKFRFYGLKRISQQNATKFKPVLEHTLWGIKNCSLFIGTITLQNYAILW